MSAPLTFLFTDLEDSTGLWERAPEAMREALATHTEVLAAEIEARHGRLVKNTGDGVMAVFESPADAVNAAVDAQLSIAAASWPKATGPLKVRMGLHTGESEERGGDFFGPTLNRAARVMGIGYGGQILVSDATRGLLLGGVPSEMSLLDLGGHRLKGIASPVGVFQVCYPGLVADFPPLRSLSTLQHNLPGRLSSFVGRDQLLVDIQQRLAETRLLTLVGPGGIGKTSLMLRVAEEVVDEYPDGVWLVELAPVTDANAIPERIATVLGVTEQAGRRMIDTLAGYLASKETLLLVDNVEHLVSGTAEVVERLLVGSPTLNIMTTSREPLLVSGEATLAVPSLTIPDVVEGAESIAHTESVELFLERARSVRPDFEVTDDNAASVAELVRQLDGIPLALELAAARLRMLKVEQIAERLTDRFRLLTGGGRTAVPRHQTLEATIDWSWNLLDETERTLLSRLAVFSGGWSMEAAQAVAGDDLLDEFAVFDNLERLVDKSLVTVDFAAADAARYGMLESIRQYAGNRLAEGGAAASIRRSHADFYTALAEEAGPHLVRSDAAPWVEQVVLELDNLRAAIAWSLEHHPQFALRIGGSLLEWEVNWLTLREGRAWIEPAVAAARELRARDDSGVGEVDFMRGLVALGHIFGLAGENVAAKEIYDECIELAHRFGEAGDAAQDDRVAGMLAHAVAVKTPQIMFTMPAEWPQEVERVIALIRGTGHDLELAWLLWAAAGAFRDDAERSVRFYEEAGEILAAIGNPQWDALAEALRFRADMRRGDLDAAEVAARAWVDQAKVFGNPRPIAQSMSELGHLLRRRGEVYEAESIYKEAIVAWMEIGQFPAVAHQLESLAYIAVGKGESRRAAQLLGAAAEARRQLDAVSTDPAEIAELDAAKEQLALAIGEAARDDAIAEGMRLSLDDAVTLAVGSQSA